MFTLMKLCKIIIFLPKVDIEVISFNSTNLNYKMFFSNGNNHQEASMFSILSNVDYLKYLSKTSEHFNSFILRLLDII